MRHALLLAAVACLASGPASAADFDVDLELVLAVDVSRSMDYDEQQLQRQGYIAALTSSEVLQAIADGAIGKIAIAYVEWAGPAFSNVIVPWTVVSGAAEANAFAGKLAAAPLGHEHGTSISTGLTFAAGMFADNGFRSLREAIDVSGDGPNNAGPPVAPVRDQLVAQGFTINGLPIILKTGGAFDSFSIPNLDDYYETCVIGGPGAFMVTVSDVSEFPAAIRRKLVQEISGLTPRVMHAADTTAAAEPVDCMIGEKMRGRFSNPFFR